MFSKNVIPYLATLFFLFSSFLNVHGQNKLDSFGEFDTKSILLKRLDFYYGLARVKIDNKFGYINDQGNLAIAPKFDGAYQFSEGIARVLNGKNYFYIDTTGERVSDMNFDYARQFKNGFGIVKNDTAYGAINKEGELIIPFKYNNIRYFSENFVAYKL